MCKEILRNASHHTYLLRLGCTRHGKHQCAIQGNRTRALLRMVKQKHEHWVIAAPLIGCTSERWVIQWQCQASSCWAQQHVPLSWRRRSKSAGAISCEALTAWTRSWEAGCLVRTSKSKATETERQDSALTPSLTLFVIVSWPTLMTPECTAYIRSDTLSNATTRPILRRPVYASDRTKF